MVCEASRSAFIVNGDENKRSCHTIGSRCADVVDESDDIDILAIRSSDPDVFGLLEGVVEGLDVSVEMLSVLALELLGDVVDGGLVAGEAKGTVAAVLLGDCVEVFKGLSKPIGVSGFSDLNEGLHTLTF